MSNPNALHTLLPVVAKAWPWLLACGDDQQLFVDRSTGVYDTDTAWEPVREHIERHHLVLVERRTIPDPGLVLGERQLSWYAVPELQASVSRHPAGRAR